MNSFKLKIKFMQLVVVNVVSIGITVAVAE